MVHHFAMIQVRRARPEEVIDLRHAVLRAGLPRETAVFPGDDAPDTVHVVAVDGTGGIVGCATMLKNSWQAEGVWQVRGMAVSPTLQRSVYSDLRETLPSLEAR